MTQFVKNDPREKSSIPSPNTIQSTFNHSEIVEDTDADMEAEKERLLNGSQTSNANHEQRGSVTFDEKGNVTAHARHFLLVESIIQGITQHHVILIEHKNCNPFVLCRPMRDRNFRLCPITIPQIEEEKPVEGSPPTQEMAGCRINPAAAGSGSRPNPRRGAVLTAEQLRAKNKRTNDKRREREKELRSAVKRDQNSSPLAPQRLENQAGPSGSQENLINDQQPVNQQAHMVTKPKNSTTHQVKRPIKNPRQ